jgi:hypothetical protein
MELWYFKAVTSYCGERFQVPTRLTTVTRQTGEYKVDVTHHPKFPLAFGERWFFDDKNINPSKQKVLFEVGHI